MPPKKPAGPSPAAKKLLSKTKTEPKKRSRSATAPAKPVKKAAKAEGDASAPAKVAATKVAPKQAASAAPAGRSVYRAVPHRASYSVLEDYSFTLNQTNIGENNNKYYVGQVLTDSAAGKFHVFFEWGRVGAPNPQNSFVTNIARQAAISQFEQKFRDKTGNSWSSRKCFQKHDGKYQLVETEEASSSSSSSTPNDGKSGSSSAEEASSPLGKLTKKQIDQGMEALDEIEKLLKQIEDKKKGKQQKTSKITASEESELVRLSSRFFSLIPTDIGRTNTANLIIRDMDTLQAKKEKLRFWLRMAFEVEEDEKVDDKNKAKPLTPISGVLTTALPKTLKDALPTSDQGCVSSAVAKGAQHEKWQTGNPSTRMNKELYAAICLYTGSFYSGINATLRDANRDKILPYFKYLKMLFEACERLKFHHKTLWRGIGVDLSSQYKVGNTVTWWSISSVTSAKSVAEGFMHSWSGPCTFCTIEAKTAVDISCISFIPSEKEYLLLPGTQLKVKAAEMKGKVFHVTLEEVGRLVN